MAEISAGDNVIWGTDFKSVKSWPEEFYNQPAGSYLGTLQGIPVFASDATPSDYTAPDGDCA